jgi:hypothetical protein
MWRMALANKIALLNDALRKTFTGGKVMMTAAVDALPVDVKANVLQKVRSFNEFDANNDPHCEHDFGRRSRGNVLFQDRLLFPRHARRLGRSKRPAEDDARADHHVRVGLLTIDNTAPQKLRGEFLGVRREREEEQAD